jgi:hypothetical protein
MKEKSQSRQRDIVPGERVFSRTSETFMVAVDRSGFDYGWVQKDLPTM